MDEPIELFRLRYIADIKELELQINNFVENCTIIPVVDNEDLEFKGLRIPFKKHSKTTDITTDIDLIEIDIDTLLAAIKAAIKMKPPMVYNGRHRLLNPN